MSYPPMNTSWLHRLCLLMIAALFSVWGHGYELTIKTANNEYKLSQDELKELTGSSLTTVTPWTDQPNVYSGISLADLLAHYQISATTAKARALNDYQVEINLHQALSAGAFIVSHVDGEPMKVRNKGPFWIIFPWSRQPDLIERKYQDWSIWQMIEISFQ